MTITHDALDLTILGPPLTCSNLLNLDLTLQQPPPSPSPPPRTFVHYKKCTIGKWTVGILLQCFLICLQNSLPQMSIRKTKLYKITLPDLEEHLQKQRPAEPGTIKNKIEKIFFM